MRYCQAHWDVLRQAVKDRGMWDLVPTSGQEATERMAEQLRGGEPKFDPLMSLHWHYVNSAIENSGLFILGHNPDDPEGHHCPLCAFEKYAKNFDAPADVGRIADEIREYCIKKGFIPKVS